MKNIIMAITFVLVTFSTTTLANNSVDCELIEDLAVAIMENRQVGVDYELALKVSSNDLARAMVVDAYDKPRATTARGMIVAIEKFGTHWRLVCTLATSK